MTDHAQPLEPAIAAAGANATPGVTPADIESAICNEFYFTAEDGVVGSSARSGPPGTAVVHSEEPHSLSRLTFCVLVLSGGFTVTGESYCASPENFSAETGRREARKHAVANVWPLMVYALKQRLHEESLRPVLTLADSIADLNGTPRPDFAALAEQTDRLISVTGRFVPAG